MKVAKILFLILMSTALFLTTTFFQETMALNKTALSPDNYKKIFTQENLSQVIINSLQSGLEKDTSQLPITTDNSQTDIAGIIAKSIDQNWLNKQAGILVDGISAYLDGSSPTLPTIDITEVKTNIINNIVDTKVLAELPKGLVNKAQIREEAAQNINLPDKLNLNDLINTKPDATGQIPINNIKTLYQQFSLLPYAIMGTMIFMVVIIMITVLSPASFLKWLGPSLFLSGLIALLGARLPLESVIPGAAEGAAQKMLPVLYDSYSSYLFKEALFFTILGALLLALSFIPHIRTKSRKFTERIAASAKARTIMKTRVAVSVLLLLLIPAHMLFFGYPVGKAIAGLQSDNQIFKIGTDADQSVSTGINP